MKFVICFFLSVFGKQSRHIFGELSLQLGSNCMVGMPGLLARFLVSLLTRVFGQGFGDRTYNVTIPLGSRKTVLQFYRGGSIQFDSSMGTTKNEKTICIKDPMYTSRPGNKKSR